MRTISIAPRVVSAPFAVEGVTFNDCTFIDISVDGEPLVELSSPEEGTCFWPELLRSQKESGFYLIFTCCCGVASDAGWEPIEVRHSKENVAWTFERDLKHRILFSREQYVAAVL